MTATPTAARAEPSTTEVKVAEELAQQAFDAYSKGDFGPAIALYKKAYQNSPSGVILFNIANIYDKKLKDKDQALEYYRRYLRSSDSEPELVKRASERLDIIRVEIDAAKQAQSEDRAASSSSPPSSGFSPPSSLSTSATNSPPPPPPEPRSPYRTAGLAIGGGGVAGLGVGVVYGLIARSKNNEAESACPLNSCPDSHGVSLNNEAHRAALVSTISFIAGTALVGVGIGLYVYGPRKENRMNNNKVSIRITPQLGGLAISGTLP